MALAAVVSCGQRRNVKVEPSVEIVDNGDAEIIEKFESWQAGTIVSADEIDIYGLENCFAEFPIDSAIFSRMEGKSYKESCTTPKEDLRYLRLLHVDAEGQIHLGEMVCNKQISKDLIDIFKELYLNKYPIERMKLVDDYDADDTKSMLDNNTSCFNFRRVEHTRLISKHSAGLAVDINPLYNPQVKRGKVNPAGAEQYADRSKSFTYKIEPEDLCYNLFTHRGFQWGGSWRSSKDYQHFQKR